MRFKSLFGLIVAAAAAVGGVAYPAKSDAVAEFYSGKTISLLLGTGPGATYDAYARIFATHFSRHVPGRPNVIVQYMPGAGGVVMFSHLYNVAPRDGTVIANVFGTLPIMQLFQPEQARYDSRKFNWLGSVSQDAQVLAVNSNAPAITIPDAAKREIIVGSIGQGNATYFFPALVNEIVGTKIKIISGYPSGADIYKAMEGGEVHGYAPLWLSLATLKEGWLREKRITPMVQSGAGKLKELPDVPLLLDFAKTEEQRRMALFLAAMSPIGRAAVTPPDVPKERLAALEKAFVATVKDPAFNADMEKNRLTVDPSTKSEVELAVSQIIDLPPALITRLKSVLGM